MEPRINPAPSPILVTGGTGTLGQLVVTRLREVGRSVRVLSRGRRDGEPISDGRAGLEFVTGDLATGAGIDAALGGTEIVVHLAGGAKGDDDKARNLVRAAARGGVRHLVYISVVGADTIPVKSGVDRAMFGYFTTKHAAERIVAESGLPWTTLRATQFQESLLKVVEGIAKMPVAPVPAGWRFQPIAAAEVADRLVELALGEPAGRVPDVAGPRVYEMADLVRSYLRAAGKRRLLVPMPLPGGAVRAFRGGANLAPERAVGRRTWEEFLAAEVDAPREGTTVSPTDPTLA